MKHPIIYLAGCFIYGAISQFHHDEHQMFFTTIILVVAALIGATSYYINHLYAGFTILVTLVVLLVHELLVVDPDYIFENLHTILAGSVEHPLVVTKVSLLPFFYCLNIISSYKK